MAFTPGKRTNTTNLDDLSFSTMIDGTARRQSQVFIEQKSKISENPKSSPTSSGISQASSQKKNDDSAKYRPARNSTST